MDSNNTTNTAGARLRHSGYEPTLNQDQQGGEAFDKPVGEFPKETELFKYLGVKFLLGGILPQPQIAEKDGPLLMALLPCSVAKQPRYPDFIGYLKYKVEGEEPLQTGINVDANQPHGFRVSNVENSEFLISAVQYLMTIARAYGHEFPEGSTSDSAGASPLAGLL